MIYSLDTAQKLFRDGVYKKYFKHRCKHCNQCNILSDVSDDSNIERILYNPIEKEETYFRFEKENGQMVKVEDKRLETRSSDIFKDIIRYKCPICGHINEVTYQELLNDTCTLDGSNHVILVLGGKETEEAQKFIEQHSHTEELKKQGKISFSALGQQFTYMITPGGFGNLVTIKCNYCGETKNITNDIDW